MRAHRLRRRIGLRRALGDEIGTQAPHQAELGLEVDVVRQLQVLDEAGRLQIVGMREHELLVLRRRLDLLAELARPQRAVDQRHGDRLALAVAEGEPVAAGEPRRLARRALELVDRLALGDGDAAERHREADLVRDELDLDLAEPDLAGERMGAAIAALGRVGEREQESLVAAGEILQPHVALRRKRQRIAGEVARRRAGVGRRRLDETVGSENLGDPLARRIRRRGRERGKIGGLGERVVEQPVGVVEGRAEHLAARQVLEGRGDAALDVHRSGIDRLRGAEAGERGAVGADQEDRLDHVAARLLDGERRELAVVERALAHHPIDRERELLGNLLEAELRHGGIAAARRGEQRVRVLDGAFSAFDCDVHQAGSTTRRSDRVR